MIAAPSPALPPVDDGFMRAYELTQRHYENDLNLFSTRMNLFIVVQSALLALAASAVSLGGKPLSHRDRTVIAIFGISLCIVWELVASGAYWWLCRWQAVLEAAAKHEQARVLPLFSFVFADRPTTGLFRAFWWIRPTRVTLALPLLFAAAWIFVGFYA